MSSEDKQEVKASGISQTSGRNQILFAGDTARKKDLDMGSLSAGIEE